MVEAKLAQRSERCFETCNPQNVQEHWARRETAAESLNVWCDDLERNCRVCLS
jgi:hypothetical protein